MVAKWLISAVISGLSAVTSAGTGLQADVGIIIETFSTSIIRCPLSYKYIPENYDGILIGPSVSGNLNTSNISNYKIYKEYTSKENEIKGLEKEYKNLVMKKNSCFTIKKMEDATFYTRSFKRNIIANFFR